MAKITRPITLTADILRVRDIIELAQAVQAAGTDPAAHIKVIVDQGTDSPLDRGGMITMEIPG